MGISQSLGIESQLYASFSVVSLITLNADLKNSVTELGTRNQSQVYFQPRSIKKMILRWSFVIFSMTCYGMSWMEIQ